MKKKTVLTLILCAAFCMGSWMSLSAAAEEETEAETEAETAGERPSYNALDYVELGDYIGITVEVASVAVTEEEVLAEAEDMIRDTDVMFATVVSDGDTVNIDYVGKLDGEAFEGGSDEGYDLEIGSGTFIEGFEEGLIGVTAGDTVDLELTFPENYYVEDLAGQDVVFTVTVNEILHMPELTDEVITTATEGNYTDLDSFLDAVRIYLEANAQAQQNYDVEEAVLEQVAASSDITGYPQDLLDFSVQEAVEYYEEWASWYAVSYEDLILSNTNYDSVEDFEDDLEEAVKEGLKEEMLLMAVAETEGISLTEEEYQDGLDQYASYYGYDSPEEFREDYEDTYGKNMLQINLLEDKVFTFLRENANVEVIEEETETEDEEISDGEENSEEAQEETEAE